MIEQSWGKGRVGSVALVLGLAWLSGCAEQQQGPQVASSAGESGYAERYPGSLGQARQGVTDGEADVARINGELPTYPDALKKTDYKLVREVVVRADAAGKSQGYASNAEEAEQVQRFAREEKDKLAQQTSGAVRYTLTEKQASTELIDVGGSAAARGQERAIEKQLEERSHEANPAHRFIADNEEGLGKSNLETLEKQADEIAKASYITHIALIEEKKRLETMVRDASAVKGTLEQSIEEENKLASDPATSARRKKIAQERVQAAQDARGKVDEEVTQAQTALQDMEQRTKDLTAAYEQALDALLDKLDQLAAAEPAAAAS